MDERKLGVVGSNTGWMWLERWDSGGAIGLNSEVGLGSNVYSEEAVFTPVGSPGVSSDPVFFTGLLVNTPSSDGDLMVKLWVFDVLLVDTSSVGLFETVGGLDTARDWTVLEELSLHLVDSSDAIVVGHVMLSVVNSPTLVLTGLSNRAWWPGAVLAVVECVTATLLVVVVGNILFA